MLKIPKAFINYLQTFDDIYENLEDYNPTKKRIVLVVFDDMKADMESNKNSNPIVSKEPYLFLLNNSTLSSDNPLRFRKSLL